ncbi:ferredoxin-NADPH reductase [Actinoplanes sp. ATCC 53533]|nr:ferredoxin-NADPH reductase [Actinoplanes sp. ATCC 53533]
MRLRIRHETLGVIFDLVYLVLMTNILLVLACLPLVAGLLATDPARSWPLLALVAPLCAPGVCAAFAVLAAFTADHSTPVVATFVRAWRASARRALALGAITTAALVVLAVDARAAWGHPIGAAAIPVLLVAMTLLVATALLVAVVLAERPTVRLRDAGRVCLYLAVRRWYLTVLSLAVLAMLQTLLASHPAIALGLAAAPLLYVVWANSRFTLNAAFGLAPGLAQQS